MKRTAPRILCVFPLPWLCVSSGAGGRIRIILDASALDRETSSGHGKCRGGFPGEGVRSLRSGGAKADEDRIERN